MRGMTRFSMDFVLDPLTRDEHVARYREISRVRPDSLRERMAATQFHHLSGGYCVVIEGMVWNASRPVPYDPDAVDCIVDDVGDAYVFLDVVAGQAEDGSTVKAYFTEMLTVEIRPSENGALLLTGTATAGPAHLPEISIPAAAFYQAIYDAARDFIGFATRLLATPSSPGIPGSAEEWKRFEARLGIERWEATVERLRRVLN